MKNNKHYIITVNEPCKESWDQMSPSGCDRFCSLCNKTVIDLIDFTDGQLLEIIKKNPAGFCGRMNVAQINKPLLPIERKQQPDLTSFRGVVASLLTTMSLLSPAKSTAQLPKKDAVVAVPRSDNRQVVATSAIKETKHKVFGNVIDTSNNGRVGIVGKRVRIETDPDLFAITDRWGYYEIEMPESYKGRIFNITVDCNDASFGEPFPVRFGALPLKHDFYSRKLTEVVTMGVVAYNTIKTTPWWKRIFKRRR
ncbi:hypothetical protein ACLOAU_13010 [Niabella sp. CJ426]|uniref:hypothetical protein n=1 Tax=Niabella sp. CJ426 TaxID=3393740 RepID=UPI003CFC6037